MSSQAGIRIIALVSVLTVSASFAADGPPAWAYGFPQPGAPAVPAGGRGRGGQASPDNSPKHLAGSNLEFTLTQIRDGFGPRTGFRATTLRCRRSSRTAVGPTCALARCATI